MKISFILIGMLASLLAARGEPSERQPHPPTTRPPSESLGGPRPETPPPFGTSLPDEISEGNKAPARVAGYVVFVAVALFFFREADND